MADYKERFEKWQRETKEKFEEIDKQLNLKEKLEEGAKVVKESAQKGAEVLREGAQKIKTEAEKSEVGKQAVKAAGETAKKAWEASEPIRDVAGDASGKAADVIGKSAVEAEKTIKSVGRKAGEVIGAAGVQAGRVYAETKTTFETTASRVSKAFNLGANWTRAFDSAIKTVQKTTDWVTENPAQAATTGVSMAVGAGLGVVFTGISSHWLFNSALPAWSVKKLGEQFNDYLKNQEELILNGELSKAEAERVEFERDIVKKIGAPLLGSFAFASGAVMMTNVLNPKTITGAPIDWLLGGNPLLEGVWFFGNGMVCFKTSYEFFMIALEDQAEVQRMVKEVKGLLPQETEA
ncbi:MAG TPA: hypothetical protein VF556_17915 [Pyrinomonadaceae bacterium]|jgi:ElaB/YqjD/DUF883 family membrane-anchored ribosome-binding protein